MSRAARNSSVSEASEQAPPLRRRAALRSSSGKGNTAGDGPAGANSGRQQAALAGSRPAQRSRSRQRPAGTAGVSESPDALIRACKRQTRSLQRDRMIEHRDAARQAQQAGAVRRSASARRPEPAMRSGTAATEGGVRVVPQGVLKIDDCAAVASRRPHDPDHSGTVAAQFRTAAARFCKNRSAAARFCPTPAA